MTALGIDRTKALIKPVVSSRDALQHPMGVASGVYRGYDATAVWRGLLGTTSACSCEFTGGTRWDFRLKGCKLAQRGLLQRQNVSK